VPYNLSRSSDRLAIALAAGSREELVRDLIAAVLEASYGGTPPAASGAAAEAVFVPIQASGNDEPELLAHLAADALRAVAETDGILLPPRWLAFDEKRVTANLPVVPGSVRPRELPFSAGRPAVTIENGLPAFRGTVSLAADARAA
jgi:hypothetical protein